MNNRNHNLNRNLFLMFSVLFLLSSVSASTWNGWGSSQKRPAANLITTTTTTQPPGMTYPAFESVTATDSNAPSPISITGDSEYSVQFAPWKSFTQSMLDRWQTGDGSNYPHHLIYDCGSGQSNVLTMVSFNPFLAYGLKNFTIDGSQDNSTWITGSTYSISDAAFVSVTNASATSFYRYFRIAGSTGYANILAIYEMNLSSADYENPEMTSTNEPAGYNIACDSIFNSTYDAWYAFNKLPDVNWWNTGSGTFPHWISFMFSTNTIINGFTLVQYPGRGLSNIEFQASQDYTTWVTSSTHVAYDTTKSLTYTNSNVTAYKYYKLYGTDGVDMINKNWGIWEIRLKHYK